MPQKDCKKDCKKEDKICNKKTGRCNKKTKKKICKCIEKKTLTRGKNKGTIKCVKRNPKGCKLPKNWDTAPATKTSSGAAATKTSSGVAATKTSSGAAATKTTYNQYELLKTDLKKLNKKYVENVLNSVKFKGTKFGEVSKFNNILKKLIGNDWLKKVLDVKVDLTNIANIKRLGVPGRQGTVIQLNYGGKKYAVKVARKNTSCGNGYSGAMGFLKQARMQQIAAEYGVTGKVYAVYCGHKTEQSFMVMDSMNKRLVDIMKTKPLTKKHQQQLWDLYLLLDTKVGLLHNDYNLLNIMTDFNNDIKLIDFDRSDIIYNKHIKKWGNYPNLRISWIVFKKLGKTNNAHLIKLLKNFKDSNYEIV